MSLLGKRQENFKCKHLITGEITPILIKHKSRNSINTFWQSFRSKDRQTQEKTKEVEAVFRDENDLKALTPEEVGD